MRSSKVLSVFLAWLPFAILATLFSGLTYAAVQQSFRSNANDPQIQIAEDIANALRDGATLQSVMGGAGVVDISKSLFPYIIIYDESFKAIGGTGTLNSKVPAPPAGVFEHAKANLENRITWQPEPGVRSAIIVRYFSGVSSGFVLAGRSLSEVEKRVANLGFQVLIVWLLALASTLIAVIIREWLTNKHD